MGGGRLSAAAPPPPDATPRLSCLFHLNLAFSSLEAEARATVVQRCYWPLLRLAEQTGFPIAVETTGWTLEQIAALDPDWIAEARRLLAAGLVELVGSGHSQCAGPLMPAQVTEWNLRLGFEDYERLLGVRPAIALVNEQAYAPGLVELYAEAGFAALIVDWENAHRSHPEWPAERRRLPQRALGGSAVGAGLPVLFSESLVFQRFQRFAHGEMPTADWVAWVAARAAPGPAGLLVYANDAEVFDHRPGRFSAEPPPGDGEWQRIGDGLSALARAAAQDPQAARPALPSELLALLDAPGAGHTLALESAGHPIPVKKQDKYNVARWAVSGRDDVDLNTRCLRLYERLRASADADADAWRELCELWATDLRTHITDRRWAAAQERLAAAERRLGAAAPAAREPWSGAGTAPGATATAGRSATTLPAGVERDGERYTLTAGPLTVVLNARRGLAIAAFSDARVAGAPLIGTLEHGYYSAIELGADWYSGHLVQEAPGHHKVTDLSPVAPTFAALPGGALRAHATVASEHGPIDKLLTLDPAGGTLELEVTLRWAALPEGSLRAAHLTLHPDAFDPATLAYAAHAGGRALDRHALGDGPVDHGRAVSALVSSSQGLGLTGGAVALGDAQRHVLVCVDREVAAPLGLVTYRPVPGSFFLRLALSLTEHDDTRRGPIPRTADAPQRLRMRVAGVRGPVPG